MGALNSYKTGMPREAVRAFNKFANVSQEALNVMVFAAVHEIEPVISAQLLISYRRSGIAQRGNFKSKNGDGPGKLFEMIVNDVKDQMVKSKTGLTLRYPGGYPKSVYIRASVFTTGAVYRSGLGQSKAALKFKKTLKQLSAKGVATPGVRVQAGRGLYKLDVSQKQIISDSFDLAFARIFSNYLGS